MCCHVQFVAKLFILLQGQFQVLFHPVNVRTRRCLQAPTYLLKVGDCMLNIGDGAAPSPRLTVGSDVKRGVDRCNKNRFTSKTLFSASFPCRRICAFSLRSSWLSFRVVSIFFFISSIVCDIYQMSSHVRR